jgi:D-alanyl-D-alanine carboxypeptidase
MKNKSISIGLIAVFISTFGATTSHSLESGKLPASFIKLAKSKTLAHAGIILIDPSTQETLFADAPDATRAPASVLKLLSMTTAIRALGPEKTFTTGIYESLDTSKPNTFVMVGQGDPWLSTSLTSSKKFHRAFSPTLINAALKQNPKLRSITIEYSGIYGKDFEALKKFYGRRLKINTMPLTTPESLDAVKGAEIAQITSPPLKEISDFTLLWSDNVLADRLARIAAKELGFTTDAAGIQSAFEKTLADLGVNFAGLEIKDGNGLSKENRISARTIADLLVKVQSDPSLQVIYEGLPLAGKTGTLKNRFVKDAPTAVGLVKAKTGWINTTVSLAGYVNIGESQYVFAVIADEIKPTELNRQATREAIDKMLATIAKPKPAA